jgi:hypothetical protein
MAGVRDHGDDEEPSVEAAFSGQPPPPWWSQVTARSVVLSLVLGPLFSFVSMRLGLVPSFSMSASLVSWWTRLLGRCGVATRPFNRQENTVVQTCICACTTLSLYGGEVDRQGGHREGRRRAAPVEAHGLPLPHQLVLHAPAHQDHDP